MLSQCGGKGGEIGEVLLEIELQGEAVLEA